MIEKHVSDNQILFFMDEIVLMKLDGQSIEPYRQEMLDHWKDCYVKPGLIKRSKTNMLRQSHDNIFAWFIAFSVFEEWELLEQLLRDMDMVGWQLFESDGFTRQIEGVMPPVLEITCRMIATNEVSAMSAVFLTFHYIYTIFGTKVWNLEFHRAQAFKRMAGQSNAALLIKLVAGLRFFNVSWAQHITNYHGKDSSIGIIALRIFRK